MDTQINFTTPGVHTAVQRSDSGHLVLIYLSHLYNLSQITSHLSAYVHYRMYTLSKQQGPEQMHNGQVSRLLFLHHSHSFHAGGSVAYRSFDIMRLQLTKLLSFECCISCITRKTTCMRMTDN